MKSKCLLCSAMCFALASGLQAQDPLTNGLVAYYPFNGNANDESGNGRHGVVQGATLGADRFGRPSNAYHFNDIDSGIRIGQSPVTGTLTISAWVFKEGDSSTHDQIVCVTNTGGVYLNIYPIQNPSISGHIDFGANYFPSDRYFSPNPIPSNIWVQIVATYDGQRVKLYQDRMLVQDAARTGNFTSGTMYIGRDGGEVTPKDVFRGLIDDVRIYNRALSTNEVTQLYSVESGPRVSFVKAFTVDYFNLTLGSNYQLQVSGDFTNWTNSGAPFTATSVNYSNTNYQRIDNWAKLFFRLQVSP
jgi:hypothetical protein